MSLPWPGSCSLRLDPTPPIGTSTKRQGLAAPKFCFNNVKSFGLTVPLPSKSAQVTSQYDAQEPVCPNVVLSTEKSAAETRSLWSASPAGRTPKSHEVGLFRVKVTCRATT